MSDKTDREYRQNMLTILDRFYRGRGGSLLTKDECEAMEYAISSIKTDLKYDLLYEETTHIADADKKIEPTTKNNLEVDAVSRQAVLDLIADYDLSMGQVVRGIHALPSVTPQEPRKGEWQLTDDEMFVYCPFCHQTDYTRPIDASWKYCPECGARLD